MGRIKGSALNILNINIMLIKEVSTFALTSLLAALDQDAENAGMGSLPIPDMVSPHFISHYEGFSREKIIQELSEHLEEVSEDTSLEEIQEVLGEEASEHLIAANNEVGMSI